jgi:hypothetical protein
MKAPSTNVQAPEKHQASSSKMATTHDYRLRFGISLDVGAWCLELPGIRAHPCPSVAGLIKPFVY